MERQGLADKLAAIFINSKLTPLLIFSILLVGVFAVSLTPREEEPQIVVPMIDAMVVLPGASPAEVENLVTRPLEQKVWEIEGVEYVYSASYPSFSLVTARFLVGTDMEKAITRFYNKMDSNMDLAPPGILPPLFKTRSIDDVPIMTLTLWSEHYDSYDLRLLAGELKREIANIENVSVVDLHGS
jgi:multidrug efflux pump subunit AcrB